MFKYIVAIKVGLVLISWQFSVHRWMKVSEVYGWKGDTAYWCLGVGMQMCLKRAYTCILIDQNYPGLVLPILGKEVIDLPYSAWRRSEVFTTISH